MIRSDLKFLEIFVAVARHGSLRQAARELGTSTSNISRALSAAEHRLDVQLLLRRPSGVGLTDAGRILRDHAMQRIEEERRLRARLARVAGRSGEIVRVRCGEGFLADLVENGLRDILRTRPDIRLETEIGATQEIIDTVTEGAADIGIAYALPETAPVRPVRTRAQPLCAIVPLRDDRVTAGTASLSEFQGADLALLPRTHGVRQLLEQSAERHGLVLRPALTTGSVGALLHFVRAGHGVTFLPRFSAEVPRQQGGVRIVGLDNPTLRAATASLFVRAQRRLPSAVEAVLASLAEGMQSFAGPEPD